MAHAGVLRRHPEAPLPGVINEGRVDMRPMITGAYPLAQAREAFELASDRKRAMKVPLDFAAA